MSGRASVVFMLHPMQLLCLFCINRLLSPGMPGVPLGVAATPPG